MTVYGHDWSREHHDLWDAEHGEDQEWGGGWVVLVLVTAALVLPFLALWFIVAMSWQWTRRLWSRS